MGGSKGGAESAVVPAMARVDGAGAPTLRFLREDLLAAGTRPAFYLLYWVENTIVQRIK